MFSSLRAFQWYIICNFSSPFDPFSIFNSFSAQNRVQQGRSCSSREGDEFPVVWGPAAVKEIGEKEDVVRVSLVHVVRTHTSCLMRNKHGTSSLPGNSFLSNNFPAPFKVFSLFGSPILHPVNSLAPSCTLKSPLIESQPSN
jgi:hypothetical protein